MLGCRQYGQVFRALQQELQHRIEHNGSAAVGEVTREFRDIKEHS